MKDIEYMFSIEMVVKKFSYELFKNSVLNKNKLPITQILRLNIIYQIENSVGLRSET